MKPAKTTNTTPLALNVQEALRVVGIGRTTLYKLIGTGQVRRIKVGKRALIRYDDLQKLVSADGEESAAA